MCATGARGSSGSTPRSVKLLPAVGTRRAASTRAPRCAAHAPSPSRRRATSAVRGSRRRPRIRPTRPASPADWPARRAQATARCRGNSLSKAKPAPSWPDLDQAASKLEPLPAAHGATRRPAAARRPVGRHKGLHDSRCSRSVRISSWCCCSCCRPKLDHRSGSRSSGRCASSAGTRASTARDRPSLRPGRAASPGRAARARCCSPTPW